MYQGPSSCYARYEGFQPYLRFWPNIAKWPQKDVELFTFQPYLRFWFRIHERPKADTVSTLLEILVREQFTRLLLNSLYGFQPFLRFWETGALRNVRSTAGSSSFNPT